jgi:hypothetical protein
MDYFGRIGQPGWHETGSVPGFASGFAHGTSAKLERFAGV